MRRFLSKIYPKHVIREIQNFVCIAFTNNSSDRSDIQKGFLFIIIVGFLLGVFIPSTNDQLHTLWYPYCTSILGYTYFVAWSISFYPQIVLNYKRQSTIGLSVDWSVLNFVGFAAYAIYNATFFWSRSIQEIYRSTHHGQNNLVESNDVAFSIHASVMSLIILIQIGYYDGGFQEKKPSRWTLAFVITSIISLSLYSILILFFGMGTNKNITLTWVNILYGLSFLKLIITGVKYIPQLYLNHVRESTIGWNMWGVYLDLFGGILSLSQLVFDCWNMQDFSGISGDIVKFLLSIVCIFADIFFFLQHYVFFPARDEEQQLGDHFYELLLSSSSREV